MSSTSLSLSSLFPGYKRGDEMTEGRFFIGMLAKQTGLDPKTIRYYEERGLLPVPPRSEGGYRLYSQEAIERLEFIRKAKGLGLSLAEIKNIINIAERGEIPCSHTLSLIDSKIEYLEQRIQELSDLREYLGRIKDGWKNRYLQTRSCKEGICPLIEEISK
jgi:DNA-binding transcriptional MerR regulator